jgi:protein TonB
MIFRPLSIVTLALLITLGIFLFMEYIIQGNDSPIEKVELAAVVEMYQEPLVPEEELEPEPEPEPQEPEGRVDNQPAMEQLQAKSSTPTPQVEQTMPSVEMGSLSIDVGEVGSKWSSAVAGSSSLSGDIGQDSKGYIEVVPYTTNRPSIPEIAWKNKINGWVLVAFKVTVTGVTKDIRVLDANPRGIFEESVIESVKSWRYSSSAVGNYGREVLLTQKIELEWKNYPSNLN